MSNRVEVISDREQPIFDDVGLKGRKIGKIYPNTHVIIDLDEKGRDDLNRWFAPIVGGSNGVAPTWKKTGKVGWIEIANTKRVDEDNHTFLLTIDKEFKVVSFQQLS